MPHPSRVRHGGCFRKRRTWGWQWRKPVTCIVSQGRKQQKLPGNIEGLGRRKVGHTPRPYISFWKRLLVGSYRVVVRSPLEPVRSKKNSNFRNETAHGIQVRRCSLVGKLFCKVLKKLPTNGGIILWKLLWIFFFGLSST